MYGRSSLGLALSDTSCCKFVSINGWNPAERVSLGFN